MLSLRIEKEHIDRFRKIRLEESLLDGSDKPEEPLWREKIETPGKKGLAERPNGTGRKAKAPQQKEEAEGFTAG